MDDLDVYRLLLFLHIAVVIVALGATFSFPFLQGLAERRGIAPTRFVLEFSVHLEKVLILPGALLTFLFGLALIFNDYPGYKDNMPVWLEVSMVWFVAAFALAIFVQRRNVREGLKALDGVPDGKALPEAYASVGKRLQIVGGILGLSIIGIAFLMVWKPG